ncbi:efflux RND transporter permease subunit [Formosa haliotis]|uniref:efflux RND transporter permease subunit n=1 Tax=Formosa haliotis TaxID=1555194 RepID=UPI000AFD499F|nr:efflux RND transporter permease subunit [Formosa haliotis]
MAEVLEQPQKRTGLVLSDAKEAVTMAIIKQSDAKIGDLKVELDKLVEALKKDYSDIDFSVSRDQTKLLDYAINNLYQSLVWGVLLAFVIMFLFLKNVKSPILIVISIPLSVIVCLLFFYLLDISINIISLSGLVLGIGLMIDNSIIVIDNITQYRNRGFEISKACELGVNEVVRPLLSSALTTCAVFLPLIFLSGISGALFYDQAMAITIGLFVSLVISITLLPVLYRLFHVRDNGKLTRFLNKINTLDYEALYDKGFKWVMRKQFHSLVIIILLLFTTVILFEILPKKQMPNIKSNETLLKIDWNEPINVDENKRRVLELLDLIQEDLINQTALVGTQQFLFDRESEAKTSETTIYLQAKTQRDLIFIKSLLNNLFVEKYPKMVYKYKEVDNIFSLIFSNKEAPLVARLRNVENLGNQQNDQLETLWSQLKKKLNGIELKPIAWEEYFKLNVDAEKLMVYNVNSNILFNSLKSAFNKLEILSIVDDQTFVPLILGRRAMSIRDVLNEVTVKSQDSTVFHVKSFIRVNKGVGLKRIIGGKEGEYYPVELNVEDENVNKTMEKVKEVVYNNPHYDVNFSGRFFSNQKLISEFKMVLLISIILLYFILASQFESFVLPIIILLEVPIDLAGAFLFLQLFGLSINLMSMIGIVVMSGIIINDSILKVDTIVQLQRRGYPLIKALLVAGQRRLKPILMTTSTTILALVPLLFASGLGAELQMPLAVALIGGMILGTLVSLYFIPLCYYFLSKKFR